MSFEEDMQEAYEQRIAYQREQENQEYIQQLEYEEYMHQRRLIEEIGEMFKLIYLTLQSLEKLSHGRTN